MATRPSSLNRSSASAVTVADASAHPREPIELPRALRSAHYRQVVLDGAYSVGELNGEIAFVLRGTFPDEVWVHGEIASLRRSPAGHVYFQLVEAGEPGAPAAAVIPVSLFETARLAVNASLRRAGGAVRMTEGTRIRIRAKVDFYAPQGKVQLRMSAIDPGFTIAMLQSQRQRVLATLRGQGLVDRNASLPFPAAITRVGLVTSDGSAAMADFLHELELGALRWTVVFADARVQGAGADRSLAAGLVAVAAAGVDVIALVRGGGAQTDLATFDSELLGRTIALLDVPVITGIGHEIDTSVADAVAHASFKTPTACAAHIVDRTRSTLQRAEQLWVAIETTSRRHLAAAQRSASDGAHRAATLATRRVAVEEQRYRHRLDRARREAELALDRAEVSIAGTARLVQREAPRALREAERTLDARASRIASLDPQRLLMRGWSITTTQDGSVVRSPDDVRAGDPLVTRVADGSITSTVTTTNDGDPQ